MLSNELVSPRFVVASRYGTVSGGSYNYDKAVKRCEVYEEHYTDERGVYHSYEAGTWRLPTLAELEFMYTIQNSDQVVNYLYNTGGSIGVLENIGVIILEPRVQVTDMKQQIALIAIDLFAVYMIFTDFMNL